MGLRDKCRPADLSGHVAAFLGTRGLVLDMNPGSPRLNHHLGKLHYRRQTYLLATSEV